MQALELLRLKTWHAEKEKMSMSRRESISLDTDALSESSHKPATLTVEAAAHARSRQSASPISATPPPSILEPLRASSAFESFAAEIPSAAEHLQDQAEATKELSEVEAPAMKTRKASIQPVDLDSIELSTAFTREASAAQGWWKQRV